MDFMKKMMLTKTSLMILISGSMMFGACKNNNSNATSGNTDTPGVITSWFGNDNGLTGTQADKTTAVTPPLLTPNPNPMPAIPFLTPPTQGPVTNTQPAPIAAATSTTGTDKNLCVAPKHKSAYRSLAYTHRHKTVKKNNKITTKTEENIAVTEPVALPLRHNEEIVNVDTSKEGPAIETQSEFTGNIPVTITAPKKIAVVHVAPEVGGNLNNLFRLSEDFQTSNMLKVGFNAGVAMNVRLGDRWAVEPVLRYIMKGSVIKSSSSDAMSGIATQEKDKLTFHYIELPVNLVYNTGNWGNGHFLFGAGPYISLLVNAQNKTKITTTNAEGTTVAEGQQSLPIGDPSIYGNVSSFDAGIGGFVGYILPTGVYAKAGAEMGMLDLQQNTHSLSNFYDRNYNFLLSIGYLIGYNK